jgi:HEAT repeat-containing protein 3
LRRYNDDQPTKLEQELKLVGYLLSAQRMAAEILSNICTPDDDTGLEDVDDKSDAESVQDYDIGLQMVQNNLSADKIPVEIAEAIKAHQIVEKVSKLSYK